MKWWGWFMKAPLLFDPTGGRILRYQDQRRDQADQASAAKGAAPPPPSPPFPSSIGSTMPAIPSRTKNSSALPTTGRTPPFRPAISTISSRCQAPRRHPQGTGRGPGGTRLTYATIGEAVFKALAAAVPRICQRNQEPALAPIRRKYEQCPPGLSFSTAPLPICGAVGGSSCPTWSNALC